MRGHMNMSGHAPPDEPTLEWAIGLMTFKSQAEMEGYITTTFYVDLEKHATQEEPPWPSASVAVSLRGRLLAIYGPRRPAASDAGVHQRALRMCRAPTRNLRFAYVPGAAPREAGDGRRGAARLDGRRGATTARRGTPARRQPGAALRRRHRLTRRRDARLLPRGRWLPSGLKRHSARR